VRETLDLDHPLFRAQYNSILLGLTDAAGPLSESSIHAFLDAGEPVVGPSLAEDPYAGVASTGDLFAGLRAKVSPASPRCGHRRSRTRRRRAAEPGTRRSPAGGRGVRAILAP
jgi:hypothetical protein